jgi:hypothetical protein
LPPFEGDFTGGVGVAVGNVAGSSTTDVIATAGPGGGPRVEVFDGTTGSLVQNFFAYDSAEREGVSASALDVSGDGSVDLVTTDGPGQTPDPLAFDATTLSPVTPPSVAYLPVGTGYDTAPTVAITSTTTSPTNATSIPVTATFNKAVTGFTSSGITVTDGTESNFAASSATTYTFDVAPSGSGTVTVSVAAAAATDAAGNGNTAGSFTITSDTTLPTVTANPLTTNDSTPTLTGTVTDSLTTTVSLAVDGQTIAATVSGGNWSATVPTALPDGSYDIVVTATDAAGNTGNATASDGLVISMTDPTVTANTLTTNNTTPTLTGTVTDTLATTVSVSVGGQTIAATVSGGNWSATVPTALTDGSYNIVVTATDAAGNTGTATATNGLVVSTTDPTVTANPLTTNDATPTLTGTVTDSLTTTVSVAVDGQTIAATVSGTTWTAIVPTALTDGSYNIVVTATDAAGNIGTTTATNGLVVATTPPTVTIDVASTASITGTAAGSGVSVTGVSVSLSNGTNYFDGTGFNSTTPVLLPATTTNNWATWSLAFSGGAGVYTVQATATDAAGNTGQTSTTVTVS